MTRSISSLATLLLLAACETASYAQQTQPAGAPAIQVSTTQVAAHAVPQTLRLTGSLIADRESALAADVSGKVVNVAVERGSRVRAGATLLQVDRRQAQLMEDEARTQAQTARTRSELASLQCTRARALFEHGALNEAEYDLQRSRCDEASLDVAAAGIREALASKSVGDALIKAPFDGVIAERFVNLGEYVRADSKVVRVVQLDPLRLELSVPEEALAALTVGTEVHFRVATFDEEVFVARVRYLGAALRASRDLLVEAVVANPDQRLRPGMFAVADVLVGQRELPGVPEAALRRENEAGTDRVFVVHSGQLEERLVQTLPAADGFVPIRAGLAAGELIAASATPNLRDGLRVQ